MVLYSIFEKGNSDNSKSNSVIKSYWRTFDIQCMVVKKISLSDCKDSFNSALDQLQCKQRAVEFQAMKRYSDRVTNS